MALSDFQVFQEETYEITMEGLDQQIELFNAATGGAIVLSAKPFKGDFDRTAFFARLVGLVRRRNPYGSGAVAAIDLEMLVDTMVKVAGGTPPVNMPPSMFRWIQQNPAVAAAMVSQQLSQEMLKDMLHIAIGSVKSALAGQSSNVYDGTAGTLTHRALNQGQAKLGDFYQEIVAWVMHSKPLFDMYDDALANTASLFSFGTVNVKTDPFGRPLVITDDSALVTSSTYHTLGLVPGAVMVAGQDDFDMNIETSNGDENIQRTYQAEWSYGVGVKGFTWDETNGGKAPTTAALLTSSNWDKVATSHKHLAGVLVNSD